MLDGLCNTGSGPLAPCDCVQTLLGFGWCVSLRIRSVPQTFRVSMASKLGVHLFSAVNDGWQL
jgi:hypothetical protein